MEGVAFTVTEWADVVHKGPLLTMEAVGRASIVLPLTASAWHHPEPVVGPCQSRTL